MKVKVTDESKIAMASKTTDPMLIKAKAITVTVRNCWICKPKSTVGNKTFNDAYATLVSDVGNKTATLKTSTTQNNVVNSFISSSSLFPALTSTKSTVIYSVFSSITWLTRKCCKPRMRCLMH
jgi:hypothetical protein